MLHPLEKSSDVRVIVPFLDMPDEYAIVGREDVGLYPGTAEIFAQMPAAKTLAVLYEANHDRLRSVYQSPAVFG